MISRQVRFFFLYLSLLLASSAFVCFDSDYLFFVGLACSSFLFTELKEVVDFDLTFAQKLNDVCHIFLLDVGFFEHRHKTAVYPVNLILSRTCVKKILSECSCLIFLLSSNRRHWTLFLATRCVLLIDTTIVQKELLFVLKSLFWLKEWVDVYLLLLNLLLHLFKLLLCPYLLVL